MLLHMNTDSLITLTTCRNIYADMNEDIEFYDTSNFDKNANKPIALGMHCDIPGLLKDEVENTKIKEGILMVQRHTLLHSPTVKK